MSKILKGLNEVNPHNYDSDWDYQDAVAKSGRSRSSYRSQEDDTFDDDVAYSRKMYQLGQQQKAAREKAQRDSDHDRLASGTNEEQLDELSNEKLGQYKTAAAADAGKADLAGDYKKADKRFSGIVKATKKQFANDTKTVKEDIDVVYEEAKSLLTQLDENMQQKVINALKKNVDGEQPSFKTGYPRINNPKIAGTNNKAKSIYYPPSKPNVKKLDKPLPESLGDQLKSKSIEALQQVKQKLEQQRMADLEQWEKDFKQNTVAKFTAREPNLRQRVTSTPMVAMPGEKHSVLKARLAQLDKAIEKQGILDNLVQKLEKKGLLTPNIQAGVDTSMLVRDGARDNYVELNRKLDKALEYVKTRLMTNKAAYAKPKAIDEDELDENCWKGYHKEGNKELFGKTVPNCVKNESEGNFAGDTPVNVGGDVVKRLQVGDNVKYFGQLAKIVGMSKTGNTSRITIANDMGGTTKDVLTRDLKRTSFNEAQEHSCPHCGGEMVSEELMNEKKDACYYKVKSRYKVWPSAYASGALVKCRKKGASNWGNGGKKNESSILEGLDQVDENLHKWFKEKWVRFGPDGKIRGDCARGDDSEGKPKCLPQSKAHSLGKKGRASAASRKRREDPNPERSGKAINVNTKKKSNETLDEGWKEKLGAAALAGSMALGAAGAQARVTPDGQGGFTGGLKPSATVTAPSDTKPSAEAPKGFSKEYLQKAADPNRIGRYMISVEKAQELLKTQGN